MQIDTTSTANPLVKLRELIGVTDTTMSTGSKLWYIVNADNRVVSTSSIPVNIQDLESRGEYVIEADIHVDNIDHIRGVSNGQLVLKDKAVLRLVGKEGSMSTYQLVGPSTLDFLELLVYGLPVTVKMSDTIVIHTLPNYSLDVTCLNTNVIFSVEED